MADDCRPVRVRGGARRRVVGSRPQVCQAITARDVTGRTRPHDDGHPPRTRTRRQSCHVTRLRFNNDDHDDFIRPHPPTPYQRTYCVSQLSQRGALSLGVFAARVLVRMGVVEARRARGGPPPRELGAPSLGSLRETAIGQNRFESTPLFRSRADDRRPPRQASLAVIAWRPGGRLPTRC